MNDSQKVLIEKLATLRRLRGYTQESFAAEIEIGYKHYQKLETGLSANPRLDTLDRIAKALEMETWQLLHPQMLTANMVPFYQRDVASHATAAEGEEEGMVMEVPPVQKSKKKAVGNKKSTGRLKNRQ